jgi:hypothetical protein
MLTRGQKRRMGLRDLWDTIVNNDDICFKHVLPKLNQTDLKFLYDVNTETRALIKRAASSGITLEEKFKIEEMSSISTLEFAWNNVRWGEESRYEMMDQAWFCYQVAWTNKLERQRGGDARRKCKLDHVEKDVVRPRRHVCFENVRVGGAGNLEIAIVFCHRERHLYRLWKREFRMRLVRGEEYARISLVARALDAWHFVSKIWVRNCETRRRRRSIVRLASEEEEEERWNEK